MTMNNNTQYLLKTAIQAALQAGREIMQTILSPNLKNSRVNVHSM